MYTTFGTYIENFDSQSNFIIEHATAPTANQPLIYYTPNSRETNIDQILNNIYNRFKDNIYIDFIIISSNNKLNIISNNLLKKINNLLNTKYRSDIKVILFDLFTSFGNINIDRYNYPESIQLLIKDMQIQYNNDNKSENITYILNNIKK